jgi:hypothetical protein
MSQHKAKKIFPEMPEQPDMSDVPILENQQCDSWCPSREVQMMIIIPLMVVFLAAAAYCAYANWPESLSIEGFQWPWEKSTGMKMPWQ